MSDAPKDSTTITVGLVKLIVGVVFVIVAILSQWFYLLVQVSRIQQQSDENRQVIQKMQDKLDEKLSIEDFEKRHQDLQHRVDNLEDLNRRR